jgi:outer membrane protein assembly factor BamB
LTYRLSLVFFLDAMKRRTLLTAALIVFIFPLALPADDWPQWRGPKRDGVWRESGVIEKFDGPEIKLRWRVPIAGGYSGPTVAQGRVYVTDRVTEPAEVERIHCFDWRDGHQLWSYAYPCHYTIAYRAGPRASVTIDGGRAYALGSMGHLVCCDAADGKVLWKKEPLADFQARVPTWGIAAAPLVEKDLLILQIGGAEGACIVALDTKTGHKRWAALDDPASYAAPICIDQAGRRVLVCWTSTRVAGLDPDSGKLYWEHPFVARRLIDQIITPVWHNHWIFVSSFGDGSLLLKLATGEPQCQQVWQRQGPNERQTDSLHSLMCNPDITDDYIYGVDSYGEFRCLDARTGDRLWEDRTVTSQIRFGTLHMVRNGEKIWMFNDRGELIICRLSPRGFQQLSRAKLLRPTRLQLNRGDGVTWSHPAFAYRHVFNRNDEELVCANLATE